MNDKRKVEVTEAISPASHHLSRVRRDKCRRLNWKRDSAHIRTLQLKSQNRRHRLFNNMHKHVIALNWLLSQKMRRQHVNEKCNFHPAKVTSLFFSLDIVALCSEQGERKFHVSHSLCTTKCFSLWAREMRFVLDAKSPAAVIAFTAAYSSCNEAPCQGAWRALLAAICDVVLYKWLHYCAR